MTALIANWRPLAACLSKDTNLWFPPEPDEDAEPRKRETPRMYREAKKICLACPVRVECLEYALAAKECCGMWGAMTRPERAALLRLRRREARLRGRA